LLDGPPEQWVDNLLPLVREDGVGTLIVATDDPDVMQVFAEQVIPPLRAAVDQERASGGQATAPG
jgi:alkanesulfonate monooxygenase SsuD/methylene tetrahydromethanopterin reductase-like flavin-dependent oxidoreductase (luciferase family)